MVQGAAAMPREYLVSPLSPQLRKGIWYKMQIGVQKGMPRMKRTEKETALLTMAFYRTEHHVSNGHGQRRAGDGRVSVVSTGPAHLPAVEPTLLLGVERPASGNHRPRRPNNSTSGNRGGLSGPLTLLPMAGTR